MTALKNTVAVVGLAAKGEENFTIPTDTIRVKLYENIPWTDPTGTITIEKIEFNPFAGRINLTVHGHVATQPLRVKALPVPVEIGFVIDVNASIVFEAEQQALYCQAEDVFIRSLSPLDGLGVFGEIVGEAVPKVLGKVTGALRSKPDVSDDSDSIEQVVAEKPPKPGRLARLVPAPVKQTAGRAASGLATARSNVTERAHNSTDFLKAKLKGMIRNGINAFLQRTPIYQVPEQMNGIPLRNAIRNIQIVDDQVVVRFSVAKNPILRGWWLAGLGLLVVGGIVGVVIL